MQPESRPPKDQGFDRENPSHCKHLGNARRISNSVTSRTNLRPWNDITDVQLVAHQVCRIKLYRFLGVVLDAATEARQAHALATGVLRAWQVWQLGRASARGTASHNLLVWKPMKQKIKTGTRILSQKRGSDDARCNVKWWTSHGGQANERDAAARSPRCQPPMEASPDTSPSKSSSRNLTLLTLTRNDVIQLVMRLNHGNFFTTECGLKCSSRKRKSTRRS